MKNRFPIRKNRFPSSSALLRGSLLIAAFFCFSTSLSHAETIITIQPHTNGLGYVVTYSWKGTFGSGMDGGNNNNAFFDNNTTTVSSDYVMPSGNHAGSKIRYSQHNNTVSNFDFRQAPAAGSLLPVDFNGTNGESLTEGAWMEEASHSNIGFTETTSGSLDWYNNPNDYGGVRVFGTGIQGAASLTSWNGIDSSSAYGNVQFEGQNLLGQGMEWGVNGSDPTLTEAGRWGMVGDAKYWNDLNTAGNNNGLLIGYFPYATTFPNVVPDPDKFIDQFHVGTYTAGTDITLYIVNDSGHVPALVTEASSSPYDTWAGGTFSGTLSDPSAALDADGGGLATGLEWVLGGDPTDGSDDASIAPTFNNTTDPDFFIFNFNRSDDANADTNTTIAVEYGSDLSGWTTAEAGTDIVITEGTPGSTTTPVEVKIRRTLAVGDKLFARLNVVVAP